MSLIARARGPLVVSSSLFSRHYRPRERIYIVPPPVRIRGVLNSVNDVSIGATRRT